MSDKAKRAGAKLIVAAIVNNLDKCVICRGFEDKVSSISLNNISIYGHYDYKNTVDTFSLHFNSQSFTEGLTLWDYWKLRRLFKRLQKNAKLEASLKALKELTSYVNQTIGD